MKVETMKWNDIKTSKPENDCVVYVTNVRRGTHCYIALYDKYYDYFTLFDPEIRHHPAIEITHWFILPNPPKE